MTPSNTLTETLSDIVANSYRLMFKIQSFHWNAKGPLFAAFHAQTQLQYEDMFIAIDDLAERIRALGEPAPSSLDEIMARATVRDRLDIPGIDEMINELVGDHKLLSAQMSKGIQEAETVQDNVTADMLTARQNFHDKQAWLLDSMH